MMVVWVCSDSSLGASIPEAASQSQPEPTAAAAEPEQVASEPDPEPERMDSEPQVDMQ